jgi:indoleamine 2,3-dioxygenase
MRCHMPPAHRAFLATLEAGPSVRQAVQTLSAAAALVDAYDAALSELERFRAQHRGFARAYIAQFSDKEVGTGGSAFMPALKGYRDTTAAHRLGGGWAGRDGDGKRA